MTGIMTGRRRVTETMATATYTKTDTAKPLVYQRMTYPLGWKASVIPSKACQPAG